MEVGLPVLPEASSLFRCLHLVRRLAFSTLIKDTRSFTSFLAARGQFQVDGNVFDVEEGSVVRVAPEGRRSVRNNGSVPLIMLCVQYLCGSFDENDAADGDIVHASVQW